MDSIVLYGDVRRAGSDAGWDLDGCYVNYPDVDLIDWPALYYKENYARLQQVKARWDPLNVFNYSQSIRLPGDGIATPAG